MLSELIHKGCHGGSLLTDSHIDAVNRVSGIVAGFLIDDGVEGDGGFTNLAVADNQFALSSTNGNH